MNPQGFSRDMILTIICVFVLKTTNRKGRKIQNEVSNGQKVRWLGAITPSLLHASVHSVSLMSSASLSPISSPILS